VGSLPSPHLTYVRHPTYVTLSGPGLPDEKAPASSSQQWVLLTGRYVDLSPGVTLSSSSVVVSLSLRKEVISALRRLGHAS
jgi:hypothetical protein